MSRASWSKLGGGKLRRDCPELSRLCVSSSCASLVAVVGDAQAVRGLPNAPEFSAPSAVSGRQEAVGLEVQGQRNCMFTRAAALMSLSFWELPGANLQVTASDEERVKGAVSAKSSTTTSAWCSFFISNFLDASVILRCCWMIAARRTHPTRPSKPAHAPCSPPGPARCTS